MHCLGWYIHDFCITTRLLFAEAEVFIPEKIVTLKKTNCRIIAFKHVTNDKTHINPILWYVFQIIPCATSKGAFKFKGGCCKQLQQERPFLYHMLQPLQAKAFCRLGTKEDDCRNTLKTRQCVWSHSILTDGWGGQVLILYVFFVDF